MSPENGEGLRRAAEVTANFDGYASEQVARHNGLSDFLIDSLPIVEDLNRCNAALEAAGRPDLAIGERAEMMRADTPKDVMERTGNFAPKFYIYTDVIQPDKDSLERPKPIPATREELWSLIEMPKIESFDHEHELIDEGHFSALHRGGISHVTKVAFLRMLVLFPDFTVDFVSRMSSPENRHRELRFEPELFVAYQLMSRLVDKSDPYVTKQGQTEPDGWYLCN